MLHQQHARPFLWSAETSSHGAVSCVSGSWALKRRSCVQERTRQAVVAERDELGGEKAKLELKKMRAQQVLGKAVEEKGAAMARLRGECEQQLRQAREAEAVGQFKTADELKDQVTPSAVTPEPRSRDHRTSIWERLLLVRSVHLVSLPERSSLHSKKLLALAISLAS